MRKRKPIKHIDLRRIEFPINALASIAHRISGAALFIAIPFCIYLLDLSLSGPQGFDEARAILGSGVVRVLLSILIWGLLYHLLAGLRCIAIDLDWGVERPTFLTTAWVVLLLAPVLAAMLAGVLL